MLPSVRSLAGAMLLLVVACGPAPVEPTLTNVKARVFEVRCSATACHGGADPQADLDLVSDPHAALVDVPSSMSPAAKRVVPGDPSASLLYRVLLGPSDGVGAMPAGQPAGSLPDADIELVRAWIAAGAKND